MIAEGLNARKEEKNIISKMIKIWWDLENIQILKYYQYLDQMIHQAYKSVYMMEVGSLFHLIKTPFSFLLATLCR